MRTLRREGLDDHPGDREGDDLVQYAVEELGAVVVEGVDWPIHRKGDDLAPVPLEA